MATVVVSNLTSNADVTGGGNQSHLVYAFNQQRWWLFYADSRLADVTHVHCLVSSSSDLNTATWSASTTSPVYPSNGMAGDAIFEQRNMACLGLTNGSTDAVHLGLSYCPDANSHVEHIRATFTGTNSITWGGWSETLVGNNFGAGGAGAVLGYALGLSTPGGKVHDVTEALAPATLGKTVSPRISTNGDTTSTWTNGFGATANTDTGTNFIASYAFAPLASDAMLLAYGNGGAAQPNTTGLRYNTYASGTTWPTTGAADVGVGTTSQDQNDWCLCAVDAAHVYAFRRSGANSFLCRMYGGSAWGSPASTVPTQNHKAGSGMFAATDGTDLYLFVLDSTGNNAVMYVKGSTANGTISFGAWTQLEPAGSTARNYISGYPVVANTQIGMIFTAVNGTNFDIAVSALSLAVADTLMGQACL